MIRFRKNIFLGIVGILFLSFSGLFFFVFAIDATLSFKIVGSGIRHGTPNNVNLGMPIASLSDQEISGQFTDNFRVEDLEGYITGHYTTIQCDGVYGSAGNKLTGVYLKADDTNPTLVQGISGNVFISNELTTYTSILNPVTYIYKSTNSNNLGIWNKYGDKPWLKIAIPGGTPSGTYSGTIVFSFYIY